jgi:hypothetical protein
VAMAVPQALLLSRISSTALPLWDQKNESGTI